MYKTGPAAARVKHLSGNLGKLDESRLLRFMFNRSRPQSLERGSEKMDVQDRTRRCAG